MADAQTSDRVIAGRYRLIEPLGRGGMGTVWRALDEVLRREVAVKELTASVGMSDPDREAFTTRTFREARAAGRLSHPGVATVYDVFEEDDRLWIVLELVPSRTLGSIVRAEGPLPPRRVAEIGSQVLAALSAAHAAGVLHRDVKPENVLIAHDGRAVLTDFGIAALEDDSPVTRTGILIGTPAFMAPERASGATARRASDLWSLGVTLFLAVEGRSPFQRGHALATLAAVTYEEPGPMPNAGPLTPIITGLLTKDPAQRMTAVQAGPLLRAVAEHPAAGTGGQPDPRPRTAAPARSHRKAAGRQAAQPTRPPRPPRPRSRRVPWAFAVVAASMIAVAGAAAGGVAYVTARDPGTGATPVSRPTVTVFTTRTAQPRPDDKQEAAESMTNAGTRSGGPAARASRTPAVTRAPSVSTPKAQPRPRDDGQGRGDGAGPGRGGYGNGYGDPYWNRHDGGGGQEP
ncbi:serine/threonine-protein kinase [Planotetraspora kaengkrachanensis]|nr:serine/threonine-protein kinase [Planotetraspora kaengkrachanensis]